MIKRILNKLYIKFYENGKFLSEEKTRSTYKDRYSIEDTFRFNGGNILLYGNGKIHCGEQSYIGDLSTIQAYDNCEVRIGKNCSISHNVRIYTQSSVADQDFSKSSEVKTGDVIIKDHAWIGANVFINPGITIGENSIVASNSVVTKDVESFSIVGGIPAKLIRMKKI